MELKNYWGLVKSKRADIGMLILRVGIAFIFLAHGALNLTNDLESTNKVMTGFGFPNNMAYIVGVIEITSAVMMLAGFLVAYAAWAQIIISLGLIFLVNGAKGFKVDGGGYEYTLTLLIASTAILLLGPGKFVLEKRWGHGAKNLREEGVEDKRHTLAT